MNTPLVKRNLLSDIRAGNRVELHIGRNNFKKLWDWCLAHSEINGVNVRVLWSCSYAVKQDKVAKRMGRATPRISIIPRFNYITEQYEIGYTDISWSYVY